jgi:penicillin-binding protein 1B
MSPARRRLVIAGLVTSALLFLGGFVLTGYLWSLSRRFPEAPFQQPSRLYGSATLLAPGTAFSAEEMVAELESAGYHEDAGEPAAPLARGSWRRTGDRVAVQLRKFPTPQGVAGGVPVEVDFRGDRVSGVRVAGRPAASAALEPPLLASYYDREVEERRPVVLKDLPDPVVKAVLAAEDSGFFTHPGISPTGILRALWSNLRGGEIEQGGSTITQQLAKNVYLNRRRTLTRKAKEAMIAVVLEARYGKDAILEAYLNEIYLGRSGPANLIGFGAASRAFFGKDAAELTLPEAATLAGMIHAPSDTSPIEHPEEAQKRRDWVLHRMGELRWISDGEMQQALAEPLTTRPETVEARPLAPYFAEAAAAEAKERFDVGELDAKGYLLFSTLSWRDQRQAEAAVAAGLKGLEGGWEKKQHSRKPLQAALVSVDPRDGSVLAWVGGRDFSRSQFDRVTQARRQAGSAFKPVIYAAAFSGGVATAATLFRDSPITVRVGIKGWQPQNYDRGYHGWVTARTALEQSLNIPTVRLALQVGMDRVVELAHGLGITGELDAVPAAALGTFEVTPLEMAQVYSTFAAGGVRQPIHALAAVIDPQGEAVLGDDLPEPRRVLPPQDAYLITNILQGVVDHGTAAGARSLGVTGPLAGKTGTTNDRRDSWFAGYSPDRVTVVWVGYDDNTSTQLSGARAALPLWARFTAAVRPAAGYRDFVMPAGMVRLTVDPVTGQLATPNCPQQVTEIFPEGQAPMEPCQRHSPGYTGDSMADLSLGQPLLDPETGQPMEPGATEEPRALLTTRDGVEIVQTNPENGSPDSSIVIRPARRRDSAPAAGATASTAGMQPAVGVVPPGSGPIGATKPPPPPVETPAEPATDGNTEATPPPP